jgi:hypothetical protein
MDGYGNDTTATSDNSAGAIAGAIAQIFSTGVTAYTDSQAIQRGYQINDPRYYQSGYPAGVGVQYTPSAAGAGVSVSASSNKTLLLIVVAAAAFLLLRK